MKRAVYIITTIIIMAFISFNLINNSDMTVKSELEEKYGVKIDNKYSKIIKESDDYSEFFIEDPNNENRIFRVYSKKFKNDYKLYSKIGEEYVELNPDKPF